MADHSWQNQMAKLRSGGLDPEERKQLEERLRAEFGPELEREGARLATSLRLNVDDAVRTQDPPEFEQLAAYVDGTLDDVDREVFEARLAEDALLRQEVEDLRALRAQLAAEAAPAPVARVLAWRRPALALTGLLAAAALIVLALRLAPPAPVASSPREAQLSPPPRPAPAPERMRVRDGGGQAVLRTDGSLEFSADVSPELRDVVADALGEGRLPLPKTLASLQDRAGVLMGPSAPRAAFAPVAPVGTVVPDGQPSFRWTPRPGARAYVVAVFDEQLERQAASGELSGTEWHPERPLAPGRTYLWQVTALTPEGRVTAPAPPAPQAKLRVLAAGEGQELERRLAGAGESRLAQAVLLASYGLLDEAEPRLRALVAENPGSPELSRLLAEVRDRAR